MIAELLMIWYCVCKHTPEFVSTHQSLFWLPCIPTKSEGLLMDKSDTILVLPRFYSYTIEAMMLYHIKKTPSQQWIWYKDLDVLTSK